MPSIAIYPELNNTEVPDIVVSIVDAILVATLIASVGLFEANAIQFGMNQMSGESSTQLSTFIHWYF